MMLIIYGIFSLTLLTSAEIREKREYSNFYNGFSLTGVQSPYLPQSVYNSPSAYESNEAYYNSQYYLEIGQPYVATTANSQPSYAQWCQDVCNIRSYGRERTVDLELSPKDSMFYEGTISFEEENCICREKVPKYQISGLCSYNLKSYNICDLTCQGRGNTKLVDIFGSYASYIRGECINNECYCSLRQFDYPMKTKN